jgi:protein subunit release factor A
MIKEAENIILNKEYFELSEEELATVSELVQNAEEYEEMKWFLASTQQALVSDKIQATPELKQKVMDHLNQPKDDRKFWLNGVVVFLFPEDKKFLSKTSVPDVIGCTVNHWIPDGL